MCEYMSQYIICVRIALWIQVIKKLYGSTNYHNHTAFIFRIKHNYMLYLSYLHQTVLYCIVQNIAYKPTPIQSQRCDGQRSCHRCSFIDIFSYSLEFSGAGWTFFFRESSCNISFNGMLQTSRAKSVRNNTVGLKEQNLLKTIQSTAVVSANASFFLRNIAHVPWPKSWLETERMHAIYFIFLTKCIIYIYKCWNYVVSRHIVCGYPAAWGKNNISP